MRHARLRHASRGVSRVKTRWRDAMQEDTVQIIVPQRYGIPRAPNEAMGKSNLHVACSPIDAWAWLRSTTLYYAVMGWCGNTLDPGHTLAMPQNYQTRVAYHGSSPVCQTAWTTE